MLQALSLHAHDFSPVATHNCHYFVTGVEPRDGTGFGLMVRSAYRIVTVTVECLSISFTVTRSMASGQPKLPGDFGQAQCDADRDQERRQQKPCPIQVRPRCVVRNIRPYTGRFIVFD